MLDDPEDDVGWADRASLLSICLGESTVTTIMVPIADLKAGRFDRARADTQSD